MGLVPAGLNMSHCGPIMEIVRKLDLKCSFRDFAKTLNGLGVAPKSPYAPYVQYTRLCFRSLSERGNFSGTFNGWFRCRISRLCVVIRGVHGAVY